MSKPPADGTPTQAKQLDLRIVAELAPTPMWLSDADGRPTWFNTAWRERSPHADANLKNRTWDGTIHPKDADGRAAILADACKRQIPFTHTHRFLQNSTPIWVTESAQPIVTEGTFRGFVGTWHPCPSPHPHALSPRETARGQLAQLVEAVPGIVWESWTEPDPTKGRTDYVNQRVESLLGYTREEWLASPDFWLTTVHPEDLQQVKAAFRDHFDQGGFGQYGFRLVTKNGETRHVVAYQTVLEDEDGNHIGMRGVTIDISERIAAEDALREQTGLYQSLLTAQSDLGEGVVIFSEARFHFCNPAFRRMTGHTEAELAKMTFIDLIAPDDRALFARRLDVRRPRRPRAHEARIATRAGHSRLVEITLKPLHESPERRWIAIVRDITDRRAAEEELAAARREVAQSEKLSLLGSLVSGLAHEIRTPLAYLDNHVTLLEARIQRALTAREITPDLLEDIPGHAAAAHEGVDRINRLVKDLRRFIRMEVSTREPNHLDEVVEDALRLYESAHNARTRINMELGPAGIVNLDAAQIQQVVINLIDNALDASPKREKITVQTVRADDTASILIHDHGVGIPNDVAARMYDPFFSTKPQGTGLGLAIVRRIVEAHHGTVTCESHVGKGTTFKVSFPVTARTD